MQPHQKELFFYPSDYEVIEVVRNGNNFDVTFINHDGDWNEANRQPILEAVAWQSVIQMLSDDYGIKL